MGARGIAFRHWFLGVALVAGSAVAVPAFADEPAPEAAQVAASGDAAPAHEDHEHHVPTLDDYNWFNGFLGEKEGVEPSLLWRPKGMPVPFGAMLLNSAILYYLLIRLGKKPISDALKSRKANILRGMEEAGKMKAEAQAQLADYEQKLANVDQEIERVRKDMRASGEAERKRILSEAKEKRTRMERDAQTLIGQELKAARESLQADLTRAALRSAEASLRSKLTAADQSRLAEEYLSGIKVAASALRGKV